MANFHTYSFGNIMLIARQKPDATNVAGLRTWNSLGRFVKRGEKGIFILAPMVGKRSTNDVATDEPSEDATTEGQRTLYGFRAVYVFDRLSRDLWPSLCALDGIREYHFRKSSRLQQSTSSLNSSALCNAPSHAGGCNYWHLCSPAQGSERERCLHQLSSTQVPAVSFSSK
jgi:hypothetical protein